MVTKHVLAWENGRSGVRPVCAQIQEDLKVLRHEVLRSGEAGVQLPVNLKRLIWNAQQIFHCQPHRRGPSGAPAPERSSAHFRLSASTAAANFVASDEENRAAGDCVGAPHCMSTHLCASLLQIKGLKNVIEYGAWGAAEA